MQPWNHDITLMENWEKKKVTENSIGFDFEDELSRCHSLGKELPYIGSNVDGSD